MKQTLFLAASIILGFGALTTLRATDPPPASSAAASHDEKAVRETVDKYFRGVTTANRDLLEQAWEVKSAHMKSLQAVGSADPELKVVPITTAIDWWTRVKSRSQSGKVLSLDIVGGEMAFVKFDFRYDEMHYIDYLTLYKLKDTWKIVNKTYVRLPDEPGRETAASPQPEAKPATPAPAKPAEPAKPADKKD